MAIEKINSKYDKPSENFTNASYYLATQLNVAQSGNISWKLYVPPQTQLRSSKESRNKCTTHKKITETNFHLL